MSSCESFAHAARWCVPAKNGTNTLLLLHVQPGAKRNAVVGEHGERLKIALKAPPIDGKANQALIKFVAETTGLPKSAVSLVSGETSREKRLEVRGISPKELLTALACTLG